MKIGIDIGRVIIGGDTDKPDQFFSKDYLNATAVENAFESIKKLVDKYGKENIYLVSKCGESTQKKTLLWLEHTRFFEITGMHESNVYFCEERWQKSLICDEHGINIFIDDRYSVLEHLTNLHQLYLFNPNESELKRFNQLKDKKHIKLVMDWKELMGLLKLRI